MDDAPPLTRALQTPTPIPPPGPPPEPMPGPMPGPVARLRHEFADHAILRHLWWNTVQIAPGAWRSNQPPPWRLRRLRDLGITTVVNLRGASRGVHYRIEAAACARLGLTLIDRSLSARAAAPRADYLALIDLFDHLPRPFVMHCKSGADRAGMASVLYLMTQEGQSLGRARAQLSRRRLHIRQTRTGILDHTLDLYARDCAAAGPIPIRDWFATCYDPAVVTRSFDAMPWWRR